MPREPAARSRSCSLNPSGNYPPLPPPADDGPELTRSVADYRSLAASYDASCRLIADIRRVAVRALNLRPGDTVFDVGCGTGATLPLLAASVGPRGKVIGIEHSPEMAGIARRRITATACTNIDLIVGHADLVHTRHVADALLFCYTHDVLQSTAALGNIFLMTRPEAVVVATGAKLINRWWSAPVDYWTRWRGRSYRTTQSGLARPWEKLQRYCPYMRLLQSFQFGTSYLARGTFASTDKIAKIIA